MPDGIVMIEPYNVSCEIDAPPEQTWLEVTRGIRSGDAESLTVFYEHYFDQVYRQVLAIVGRDEQTCLDIVQDTMLKIIRCVKPMANEAQLSAWTRAVTKSVSYDWLRKQKRAPKLSDPDRELEQPKDPPIDDLARIVWLEQQLQSLPSELQRLLSLRYRLGWSLRRIGEKIGLKTGAVDGRIRRAIEMLQEKAKRDFDE